MSLTQPRLTPDQLQEFIRAELPGIDFRVIRDDHTYMFTLEWLRRTEGYRAAISDLEVAGSPEALPTVTLAAIDAYREKAMVDYGLRAILEREKLEAYRKGFRAMVENLKAYVNERMVIWTPIYEDGQDEFYSDDEYRVPTSYRNDGPDFEGRALLEWINKLTSD